VGRFAGVEHANPIIPRLSRAETRAAEYSKAATKGNWQDVWSSFDQRRKAKGSAANEVGEADGPRLCGDDAGAAGEAQAAE